MKKLMLGLMLAAVGCATTPEEAKKDQYDIRPEAAAANAAPTAVEWQNKNDAKLAAATKPEVLAKFVASPAAAEALLAQIGPAYAGDPLVLTQIAAVTQLTMCPKCDKAPTARKVWIAALEKAMASAKDDYVRTFCRQQLDLCEVKACK